MSEATVGNMLAVARERIAQTQAQEERAEQVRLRREGRTRARRAARDAQRRQMWLDRLSAALAPDLGGAERLQRVADALASKGWKMQVKDLTPELEALADAYLASVHASVEDAVSPEMRWLREGYRARLRGSHNPPIDHLRVAALNSIAKNFKSDETAQSFMSPPLTRGPRVLREGESGSAE